MARPIPAAYRKTRKVAEVRIRLHDGPLASPVEIPRNDLAWAQAELRLPWWYDMVSYDLVEIDRTGVHHYRWKPTPGDTIRFTPDK